VTSITAWAGVDQRAVASVYIASDSRITYFPGGRWDQGRKVFAGTTEPHIFGYWGDVLFPALALPLVIDKIDRGVLADTGRDPHDAVERAIRSLWRDYPAAQQHDLGILSRSNTRLG
jgi:hypothetical protein